MAPPRYNLPELKISSGVSARGRRTAWRPLATTSLNLTPPPRAPHRTDEAQEVPHSSLSYLSILGSAQTRWGAAPDPAASLPTLVGTSAKFSPITCKKCRKLGEPELACFFTINKGKL